MCLILSQAKEIRCSLKLRCTSNQYEAVATTVVSMCQLPVEAKLPSVLRGVRSSGRFFWGLRFFKTEEILKISFMFGFQLLDSCQPADLEGRILEFSSSWCQCRARPCGVALLCRSQVDKVPWVCAHKANSGICASACGMKCQVFQTPPLLPPTPFLSPPNMFWVSWGLWHYFS